MSVDISKIKIGDEVTLRRVKVIDVDNNPDGQDWPVRVEINGHGRWIPLVDISYHHPAPPKAIYVQGWVAWEDVMGLRIYASEEYFEEYSLKSKGDDQ